MVAKKKLPAKVRKRDGSTQMFDRKKIERAISRALCACGRPNGRRAGSFTAAVIETLLREVKRGIPTVEHVQDVVEHVLSEGGEFDVAKSYILYRQERSDLRSAKSLLGVHDDLKLSVNAVKILEKRYLLKNEHGEVVETPGEMIRRVARAVAVADDLYRGKHNTEATEEEFYQIMSRLDFLPNSPTLMNAGTELGQLSACFVLPVDDSMSDIFGAVRHMALIHQSGGGTGFSFSSLRPKGDVVKSTGGIASGPLSFMTVFDAATDVIKQGGRRRGANMGILSVDHPDIMEFITAKGDGDTLRNFNTSVTVTDKFMEAVKAGRKYSLLNPRKGALAKKVNARDIFDLIVTSAWKCGDPGLVFIDEVNRGNPTPAIGRIDATNPCGEQPLLPYEACNLGSINVSQMVTDGSIDWVRLGRTVDIAVHFLDNVVDINRFPLEEIDKITRANRKIGLGVMGFAEMLIIMGIPYNSKKALQIAEELMRFVSQRTVAASQHLASKRGTFPNYKKSIWVKRRKKVRNAAMNTIAPTGTISLIAGCSSGIEPLFALSYLREVSGGPQLLDENRLFGKAMKSEGLYSSDLMAEVARTGSVQHIKQVPAKVRRLFVTAMDMEPEWHVKMQAAFQKHTDSGVSKTVNLPPDCTQGDVRRIYMMAHRLKCKGITVYRYGTVSEQTLRIGDVSRWQAGPEARGPSDGLDASRFVHVNSEFSGECRRCNA